MPPLQRREDALFSPILISMDHHTDPSALKARAAELRRFL
jgi:hypothetical protein